MNEASLKPKKLDIPTVSGATRDDDRKGLSYPKPTEPFGFSSFSFLPHNLPKPFLTLKHFGRLALLR